MLELYHGPHWGPENRSNPSEDLEIEFTEIQPSEGYKYLLVTACTYSGCTEAFPTGTEQSREVTRVLLREIVPRFGLPLTIHSDKGPPFAADIVQTLTKSLYITWKLHMAYRPQSSK